ncbi:MAG: hypothetical protein C0483_11305 [Pirellula sp.]|nr:hypothetical protein [Pirellula sp.]
MVDLMDTAAILIFGFWVTATFATTWFLGNFRRHVERSTLAESTQRFPDGAWPEALVILSLRGGDRSLRKTLDGLATQDYPSYSIRIVVDHPNDEVVQVIRRWKADYPAMRIGIESLRPPLTSCTLKCSAIYQVLRTVGPEVGAVVIVDGDADPYPCWLRDAMAPLADPQIGAVTGNRWYFPREGSAGGWCRFIFTAFSLPTMWLHGFSWGGTLAIRRDIACSAEFLSALAANPTEENTCYKLLPKFNKRMYVSSQLIQWNPEPVDLRGAEQHLFRQSVWGRLFYPCWTSILVGAAAIISATIASFACGALAVVADDWIYWLPLLSGFAFAAMTVRSLTLLHWMLEYHVFARQGRRLPVVTWRTVCELLLGVVWMPVVYGVALLRADLTTEISWRGIRYRILPDKAIHMTGYTRWRPAMEVDSSLEVVASPETTMVVSDPSEVQKVLVT